jgi:arylsulfatase A-like enzyme
MIERSTPPACVALLALACAVGCAPRQDRGPQGPPSVLLVVVDTLRQDALGAYRPSTSAGSSPTPNFDRLAVEGERFDAAFAAAPWTLPSVATLLCGAPPPVHGAARSPSGELTGIDPRLPTLAELLGDAGYETLAVVTNPYLGERFGLGRGFDEYLHLRADGPAARSRGAKVRGDRIVDEVLARLEAETRAPTFALVHLFDPHMGYDPPGDLRPDWLAAEPDPAARLRSLMRALWSEADSISAAERERVRDLYAREVRFADRQLARLLAAVEADPRPWLVVVTSDHGEELWDHGGFEHGHTLYDELVRVPLLVRWPDGRGRPPRADLARHEDLAPTILAAAGVDVPPSMTGRDLARAGSDTAAVATFGNTLYGEQRQGLVTGGLKLVRSESGTVRLFDLRTDPEELTDLAPTRPELVARLSELLEARGSAAAGAAVELDPELRSELEALGYLR